MAMSTTSSAYSTMEAPFSFFSHCINLLMFLLTVTD
jgi:hypothetical protein